MRANTRLPLRPIATALAVQTLGPLPVFLTGTLGVQLRQSLGLSDAGLGFAVAAFFAGSGLTALKTSATVDRIGWPRALRLAAGADLVLLLAIATAASSPALLALFLGGAGAVLAFATATANRIVATETPAHRRGLIVGLKQAAIPIGTLLAGAAVPTLALTVGWRWCYAAAAIVPLAALALGPRRVRERPRPQATSRAGARHTQTDRPLLVLVAGAALASVAVASLNGFFLVSTVATGVAEATAALIVVAASVVGITVRITAGWWADRAASSGFPPVAALLVAGCGGLLLLAWHTPATVAVGAVLAYAGVWGWPGLFNYGVITAYPQAPGAATGTVALGIAVGNVVGPTAFGAVAERVGYPPAWALVAVLALAGAVTIGVGSRGVTRPSPEPTGQPATS
jgi:MFS family permease